MIIAGLLYIAAGLAFAWWLYHKERSINDGD